MYTIRPFNPTPDEYNRVLGIHNAAKPHHKLTLKMYQHHDNTQDPAYLYLREVIEHDGEIIAYGFYGQFKWAYHPDKYYWEVVAPFGHPDDAAIRAFYYAHLRDILQERNPLGLMSKAYEDQPHILSFLAKHGYKKAMRYPHSQLDVAAFDPAPFAGLEHKMQQEGIEIKTLAELQQTEPDWMRKHYDLSWGSIQDAPSPGAVVKEPFEQFQKVFNHPNLIPECWFVAVHDGEFVGETKLLRNPAHPERLETGLTGVLRDYRRKGIATVLKVRSIQYAQQMGITVIKTDNEENNPMYQINLKLGFQPTPAMIDFEVLLRED